MHYDSVLCTYGIGRCLRTSEVRDMTLSDYNVIETVGEVEDGNKSVKRSEYCSK